ncbi:MAG TPA: hypothetical protein VK158_03300 [Acidobacteriota bacterium]|nr:hypothetical protein [Acidobacteriota bacterium]
MLGTLRYFLERKSLVRGSDRFEGVYRGFHSTGVEPIGIGELEVIITRIQISCRQATGENIVQTCEMARDYTRMTKEQVAKEYQLNPSTNQQSQSAQVNLEKIVGYQNKNGIRLLFNESATQPYEFGLQIKGNNDDVGITFAYSPRQVAAGLFEQSIERLRHAFGDNIPLLQYGGKMKPHENQQNVIFNGTQQQTINK